MAFYQTKTSGRNRVIANDCTSDAADHAWSISVVRAGRRLRESAAA